MLNIESVFAVLKSRYWPLLKAGQTMLLAITGLAGYFSAYPFTIQAWQLIGLIGTLFLTISGSTVINMWFDRDIDAKMPRTRRRPLVTGQVSARKALWMGIALMVVGLAWSLALSPVYAIVALAGLFCEVGIYTLWLKRRSAWSVALGGLAGGMPILGGRVLATGSVDAIGLMLALAVLLWTPAHNLSFNILRFDDYQQANVPTFPSVYGLGMARRIIVMSSALVALVMTLASIWMALPPVALALLVVLQAGLLGLSLIAWLRPSTRMSANLFKYASAYMLGCMVLLATAVL